MSKAIASLTDFAYEGMGVRVFGTRYEPWFVLTDVLKVMDIHTKNISQLLKRLDDDEKMVVKLTTKEDSSVVDLISESIEEYPPQVTTYSRRRGYPELWLVSEPGLYRIIFRSDKPKARAFTRFVTHEVLPSIRRYGYYKAPKPRVRKERKPTERLYQLESGEKLIAAAVRERAIELGITVREAEHEPISSLIDYIDRKELLAKIKKTHPISYEKADRLAYGEIEYLMYHFPPTAEDMARVGYNEYYFSQKYVDAIPEMRERAFGQPLDHDEMRKIWCKKINDRYDPPAWRTSSREADTINDNAEDDETYTITVDGEEIEIPR